MKTIIKTIFILSSLLFIPSLYAIQKSVIVVSNDVNVSKLSKNDLENIFLGRKTMWANGKPIMVGVCTQNSDKLDEFLISTIGKNERRFKKYWLKKVFAGYGTAPMIFSTNTKAIEFTREKENSITYLTLDDSTLVDGMKIIEID